MDSKSSELDQRRNIEQTFIDDLNSRLICIEGPVIVFGLPLKANTGRAKWDIVQRNLRATLGNLRRQSDKNFVVIVAGHDKPDMGAHDGNVCWVDARWPPPESPDGYSHDKLKKRRLILSLIRRSVLKEFYFFTLDSDDYVDPDLCAYVRSDHNRSGYYIDKGYIYDVTTGVLGQNEPVRSPFYKYCGSCAAFWLTKRDLPLRATDTSTFWNDVSNKHVHIPQQMAEKGRPMATFPFNAALYLVNHGASNIQEKGTSASKARLAHRTQIRSQVRVANVLRRFGVRPTPSPNLVTAQPGDAPPDMPPPVVPTSDSRTQGVTASIPRPAGGTAGPDFLCIGLQKAGTQWLYDQLQSHPDVWMPPFKELHYFDWDFPHAALEKAARAFEADPALVARIRARFGLAPIDARGESFFRLALALRGQPRDLETYASLFESKGTCLSGDVTPAYSTLDSELIGALARRFPHIRVCLLLRDPVARVWSAWRMANRKWSLAQKGHPDPSQREANERLFEAFLDRPTVIERSYPSQIAKRWSSAFGERFRFFFLDDIVRTPVETRIEVLGFLGVDHSKPSLVQPDFNRKSRSPGVERSPRMQALLREHFADERRRCAQLFGGAAEGWPDAPY